MAENNKRENGKSKGNPSDECIGLGCKKESEEFGGASLYR